MASPMKRSKASPTKIKCEKCGDLMDKIGELQGSMDLVLRQLNVMSEALAEQTALIKSLHENKNENEVLSKKFPVKTVADLIVLNRQINSSNREHYITAIHNVLHPNGVLRNLRKVFGDEIVMAFNIEGVQGKASLSNLSNIYSALIEAVSSEDGPGTPDFKIRKALQLGKKRIFKNNYKASQKLKQENVDA